MSKTLTISFTTFILVILGIFAFVYFYPSDDAQAVVGQCTGGTTILSLGNAFVTTSDDLAGKEVVRIFATANGGGECATINFRDYQIENSINQYGGDYEVDNSVFGELITKEQTQTFRTTGTGRYIYKLARGEKQTGLLCSIENCEATYNNVIYAGRTANLPTATCWCIYKNWVGNEGRFSSTIDRDFVVEFKIEGLGSVDISQGQQSANLGNQAFIKWSGDLMNNRWLSLPTYDTYYEISSQRWRLAEDGYFDDIQDRLETDTNVGSGCTTFWWELSELDTCLSQYNNLVNLKTQNKDSEFENTNSLVDDVTWNGVSMLVDLSTQTTFQTFTIDLDADFVGIHKNVGSPDVQCPSGRQEFVSGSRAETTVKVKDLSGTNPTFGLSYQCTNGEGSLQQNRIFNVGTTFQDVLAYSTAQTQTDLDYQCLFSAYDLNSPTNRDTCIVYYKVVPFTGCTPGQKQCSPDGKALMVCNSEKVYDEIPCAFGCEIFNGEARCSLQKKEICDNNIDDDGNGLVDKDDPQCQGTINECGAWLELGGKTIIPDLWCILTLQIQKIMTILAIVFGLVGAVFGFLITRKTLLQNKVSNNATIITSLIVAVLVGFGIWILTLIYWWLAFLSIIIFVIVKIIF